LWDLETGGLTREPEVRRGLEGLASRFDEICVGDDGRLAATATYSGLQLWDLGSGRVVNELRRTMGYKYGTVSLSADGRLALVGGQDGMQLWNIATEDVVWTVEYPREHRFHTVRLTADGRFAIGGGSWSCVVVWDVRSGRCVQVLDGHEQGVGYFAVTPDGRFVLTGKDSNLRLWELDWELAAREPADWDDGAAPYVEAFLCRHGSRWTNDDFGGLLRRLQDVGYGWLRPDGVRAQLQCMAKDLGDSAAR
jgi:WD40 repeat protein